MVTHRVRQRTRAIMIQKLLNHTAVHRADFRARPVQPNKEVPNRSQITSDGRVAAGSYPASCITPPVA